MAKHYSGKRAAGRKPVGKRALSLLMALVMSLSLVQITAFATGETPENRQVVEDGGIAYYDKDGKALEATDDGEPANWAVKVTRTLAETGTENLFNVNLEVTTKDNTVSADAEAAAVLVIDTSGSMADCATCGKGENDQNHEGQPVWKCPVGDTTWDPGLWYICRNCGHSGWDHKLVNVGPNHAYQSRLELAQFAAKSFVASFAKNAAGEVASAPRYIAIVGFADKANTKCTWVDVTQGTAAVEAAINGLTADGGTNTEAGLQLASNLLGQKSAVENRFVVLLTDGQPTYYIDKHQDNKRDGLETVPAGYTTGKWPYTWPVGEKHSGVAGPGNKTTSAETAPVETVSKALKAAGVKVYGVTYGVTEQIPNGSNVKKDIDQWMTGDCEMADVHSVSNPDKLNAAFRTIINNIQQETVGTTTVTAVNNEASEGALPNLYTFVQFTNQNGATVANNKVTWNLSNAAPESGSTDKEKTYKLSYQVQMHTESTGFAKETPYSLGAATLSFQVNDGVSKTAAFPEVAAKGYLGELNFDKVDEKGQALSGATFQLASAAKTMTAESAANVAFSSIPSGYTYTLSETSAPDGYTGTDKTWTVTVAYGEVTVAENKESDEAVPVSGRLQVVNNKEQVEPEYVTYKVNYFLDLGGEVGYPREAQHSKEFSVPVGTTEVQILDLYNETLGFKNVPANYVLDEAMDDWGGVRPGTHTFAPVFNLYYKQAEIEPGKVTYTVNYFLEKDYGYNKMAPDYTVNGEQETVGQITIKDLYEAGFENVPAGYELDRATLDFDGVAPGEHSFTDGQVFNLYYKLAPIPMPEYTVEYYLKDSDTDKYEVKYSETFQAEFGEVTIAALKAAWTENVPEDVKLDEYVLDEDMLAEGYDGIAPGTHDFKEDGQVFKLYYKLAEVEPEGPFTYWVKHIYMNGMLVDGVKDEYFENVEAGTKVVPAELNTYLDYTVNGVKHVYQVEKLDPDVETFITENDQVFYIYYQRNDPTPEYITVTVNYVELDNTDNVLREPQRSSSKWRMGPLPTM